MAKKVNTAVAEKEEEKKVEEMTTEEVLEDEVDETEEEEDDEEEVEEPKKSKKKSKKGNKYSKLGVLTKYGKKALEWLIAMGLGAGAALFIILGLTKPNKEEQKLLDEFDDYMVKNGTELDEDSEDEETAE